MFTEVFFVATMLVCTPEECRTVEYSLPSVEECLAQVDIDLQTIRVFSMTEGVDIRAEVFPWCVPVLISTSGMTLG